MKERLKKELKIALIIFLFLTITYVAFYFIDIIKHPSITGMIVYNVEVNTKNYTFTNASLYNFNDTLINLSNGIRLKGNYTYYYTTNETNQTITLFNITYTDSGIVETLDFSPSDLISWDELTKNEILNDQNIDYYYSVDSGDNYTLIDFNLSDDFNLTDVNSSKIMFRINLISNTTETAVVNYLTLKYLVNIACIEDWQCDEWSECYTNNTKVRACTDNNVCGSEDDKPDLVMSCDYTAPCTVNWTALYQDCLVNDTYLKYYNDTSTCNNISTLPSDNNTYVICDYCLPNWTCSKYGNCTGEKECLGVSDENDCYSITNLTSDNYTDDYTEFTVECNETEESTSSSAIADGSGDEIPADGGESSAKQTKLEAKVYDISVEIPDVISFIEENNFEIDIKNKGDKLDKLSFSLSSEFEDIVKLTGEVINLEKDKTANLNLSTNPLLTRTKPGLLIQGMAAKVIEKQTKNITGNLIVKGISEDEVKIDKSFPIIMEVILFDKIKLEHTSPVFFVILFGLLIAITVVYLTTKYVFKFNVK